MISTLTSQSRSALYIRDSSLRDSGTVNGDSPRSGASLRDSSRRDSGAFGDSGVPLGGTPRSTELRDSGYPRRVPKGPHASRSFAILNLNMLLFKQNGIRLVKLYATIKHVTCSTNLGYNRVCIVQ